MSLRRRNSSSGSDTKHGGRKRRGGKTCERIVCDRPVSQEHNPYCSKSCKRLAGN